ncbi:hypothetical protein GALL_243680 [mine drainage metagenome]|uniref:Uncharacterized protein n=1 Tax=mine drainage metagenome TaxID=410659 RepID=A0A1J5RP01_9ZZZZ
MFRRTALCTVAALAFAATPLAAANAHPWGHHDGLGLLALPLVAGAVAGAVLAASGPPSPPVVYQAPPVVAYAPPPAVVYQAPPMVYAPPPAVVYSAPAPAYGYSPYYGYYRVR